VTIHTIGTLEAWLAAAALGAADWVCLAPAPTFACVTYGRSWWWPAGYVLLHRAICVTAERNALDVLLMSASRSAPWLKRAKRSDTR
jgi:hypothetical protein